MRRYENQPFENTIQMEQELIKRWNNTVRVNDKVYVLGDFGANKYAICKYFWSCT